jgi:hypothetical protein
MKYLSALFTLFVIGCVPIQQQIIDDQNEKLSRYQPIELINSYERFHDTLNPGSNEIDQSDRGKTVSELLNRNFQSGFSLPGYGEMLAGKTTRLYDIQKVDPFQVMQDYLVFTISFGGGVDTELISNELIWNGKHYLTNEGLTVDLVISFKSLDMRRALITKGVKADLSALKSTSSNEIILNILGYKEKIKYRY